MSFTTAIKTDFKKIIVTSLCLVFAVISFSALPAYADVCGDAVVGVSEQCDDGNLINGDGCSSTCQIEAGMSCVGSPSVCTVASSCTAGNYWNGTSCINASAGYAVPSAGANAQTPCTVGYYQPNTGSTSCLPAPAGSYVNVAAATTAIACPAGEYQPNTNSTSCLPVPSGSFASGGSAFATLCAPGSYQPAAQSASCILASSGFFVSAPGATAQTACATGTYSAIGASACAPASFPAYGSPVVSGQPAIASDINDKFSELEKRINILNARLAALEPKSAAVSIIGTYDFVNVGAQINSDAPFNSHISHTSGRGYLNFAAGGVVTGTSVWAGANFNLNNFINNYSNPGMGIYIGPYSYVTTTIIPDSGFDSFSGTYTITGSSVSMSLGQGPINGTLSADGKILMLTLHDGDDGILIAVRR